MEQFSVPHLALLKTDSFIKCEICTKKPNLNPYVTLVKGHKVGWKNPNLSPKFSLPPVIQGVSLGEHTDAITNVEAQVARLLTSECVHGCGHQSTTWSLAFIWIQRRKRQVRWLKYVNKYVFNPGVTVLYTRSSNIKPIFPDNSPGINDNPWKYLRRNYLKVCFQNFDTYLLDSLLVRLMQKL